jgi:hypothetical protein
MSLRQYGPGKYTLVIDSLVDSDVLNGLAAESLGDVNDFGFYALIETTCVQTGVLIEEEREFLASHPWAILSENSDGFVTVTYYVDENNARIAWGIVESQYSAFLDPVCAGFEDGEV